MNSTNRCFQILLVGLLVQLSSCTAQDQPTNGSLSSIKQSQADSAGGFFRKTGVIKLAEIKESSGVTMSFHRSNAFWTINDSGHDATAYCLTEKGESLAKVVLKGAQNRDWESMSRFNWKDKHYLAIADVGDNQSRNSHCRLYLFEEPKFDDAEQPSTLKVTPIAIEFKYEDGARDCESIAIDPTTNDIWLFEKMMQLNLRRKPHVYRIPAKDWLPRLTHESSNRTGETKSDTRPPNRLVARRLGHLNHQFITGGDFSPDGNSLILRTYTHAIHFQKDKEVGWDETFFQLQPTLLPLPIQSQGEAITFFPDSNSALITSEGVDQPIWAIDIANSLIEARKQ